MPREEEEEAIDSPITEFIKKRFMHILLLGVIIAFTLIGALLFTIIEGTSENTQVEDLATLRRSVILKLVQNALAHKDVGTEDGWGYFFKNGSDIFSQWDNELFEHYKINNRLLTGSHEEYGLAWNFWDAAFFCSTVYTTISYGNLVPVTMTGRVFTMAYAAIGIPLFLTLLANYGKLLTSTLKSIWRCFKNCGETTHMGGENDYDEEDLRIPVSLGLGILLLYVISGSFVISFIEGWTYFESLYFVFISMSTIGFGDFVPKNRPFMMIIMVYMILGLALMSMFINVVREHLVATLAEKEEEEEET